MSMTLMSYSDLYLETDAGWLLPSDWLKSIRLVKYFSAYFSKTSSINISSAYNSPSKGLLDDYQVLFFAFSTSRIIRLALE